MKKYRILFLELLLLFFILVIFSEYLYFTNIVIIDRFNKLQKNLLIEFKELTGFNLYYSNISPDIIGSIKVKNVKIYKDEDLYLELGDVILSYSILNFFYNKDNIFSFIKRITLKNLTFYSEKEELEVSIKELIDKFKITKDSNSNNKDLLSKIKDIEISIINSKVEISDKEKSYFLLFKNIDFSFKNRIRVDSNINFILKEKDKNIVDILAKFNGNLTLQDNIKSLFFIDFIRNNINGIKIKKQRFSIETNGSDFFIKRLKDNFKIDIVISKESDNIGLIIKSSLTSNDIKNLIDLSKKSINVFKTLYLNTEITYNINNKKINGNLYIDSFLDDFLFFKNPELVVNTTIKDSFLKINDLSLYTNNRENFISLDPASIISFDFNKIKTSIKIKDMEILNSKINTEINITKDKKITTVDWEYFLINGEEIGGVTEFIIKDYEKYFTIDTIKKFNGYSINGTIIPKNGSFYITLNNNFENFLLTKLIKSFKIGDIKNSIYLNGNVRLEFSNGNIYISESSLTIKDPLKSILTFDIYLNNKNLLIKNINNPQYDINGEVLLNFSRNPYYSNIIIKKDNLDFNINAYIFKDSLSFDINNSFYGNINYNSRILYLHSNNFTLPLQKDKETKISFDTSFNLKNFTMNETNFRIENINIFNNRNNNGNLNFTVSLKNNRLLIDKFFYSDGENNIEGKIEQNIILNNNNIKISGNGLLNDKKKSESYSISYKIENDKIDGRFYLTHLELDKFLKGEGFLDLRIGINGDIKNPDIELNGILSDGKIGKNKVKGDFNIKKVDNKISLNRITIDYGKNSLYINDSYLKLDKNKNEVSLNGTFYVNGLGKILKSDFNIAGDAIVLNNKINSMNIDIGINNITLGILEDDIPIKIEKYNGVKFNLNINGGVYVLRNYGDKFIYATYDSNNKESIVKFYSKNQNFFDLNLNIKEDKLDGNVKFIKFPVNLVHKVLIPYVNINKGELTGNVLISGTLKNPELNGKLNLYYGGVILRKYMIEPIENITAVLFIDKNKIFVNNVNGMVQKSMVYGFGEIIFNGFKFERYSFKLNSEMVPAVVKEGPVDGNGVGYLEEFIIQSDSYSFDFIGKIFLEKGEISILNMLGSKKRDKEPKKYPINVILDIKAGKNVKVEYPIITGTIKEGDILSFKYIGNEPNIYLGGGVNLKKGEINYFNRNFQIESASFQFFENESKINPLVNIKSFFRTKDSKGDTMKVYLSVNDRLSSFRTELSSMPYKSQDELNALLGITFTTNTSETTNSSISQDQYIDTIVNTTNYFGNTFLFSPFESTIRRITGLDTFSLHTSLFGNIIRSSDYWLDLLNDTSLTFGKYLSNEIYLGSTMTFKKKGINEQIFLPLMNENYGLNFQFMLQFELPYVSFGYTFVPNDWRNFLNADHRLSFEANFRF